MQRAALSGGGLNLTIERQHVGKKPGLEQRLGLDLARLRILVGFADDLGERRQD